jgi:signal transduction histidine kinase
MGDLPLWGMAAGFGIILYLVSLQQYLLFHTLVELVAVAVAWALFLVSWNTRKHSVESGFFPLGTGYLFVGILDLLHTLAYEGLAVLPGGGAGMATQYWIAARWTEVAALLSCLVMSRRTIKPWLIVSSFLGMFLIFFFGIQVFSFFPECFIPGMGLTPFKIASEYLIIVVLVACMFIAFHQRVGEGFPQEIRRYFIYALVATALSEFSFTLYANPFGTANMVGHLLKYLSFLLIYKAILVEGLSKPFEILFHGIAMRDRILGAVARMSQELIEQPGAPDTVDKALGIIGEAAGVHRSYIFEKHRNSTGVLLTSQLHEWCAAGVASFADDSFLQDLTYGELGFRRWEQLLSKGTSIVGAIQGFPDAERNFLDQQGIVSLAIIPLFVHSRWWGFIGFDDCTSSRVWHKTELDVMQMAGAIIASWLDRKRMENDMIHYIEAEQARFGREIHDHICQEIKGLEIEASLVNRQGKAPASLEKRLNTLLQDASRIAKGLFPKELRRDEFFSALKELEKSCIAGQKLSLQINEESIPYDPGFCFHLVAICREAVCNARYHSGSRIITIIFDQVDGFPVLEVQDRGSGFNVDRRGMGIRIMEARAAAIGAILEIQSDSGKGTSVVCRSLYRQWGQR